MVISWADIAGHLIVAGVVGFVGFSMYLWKNSVYGRMNELRDSQKVMEIGLRQAVVEAKQTAQLAVSEAKVEATKETTEIKRLVENEIREIRSGYVTTAVCNAERTGCQNSLLTRIEASHQSLSEKMDLIITGQGKLGDRFDKHINGSKNEE